MSYLVDDSNHSGFKCLIFFVLFNFSQMSILQGYLFTFLILLYLKVLGKIELKMTAKGQAPRWYTHLYVVAYIFFFTQFFSVVYSIPLNFVPLSVEAEQSRANPLKFTGGNINIHNTWTFWLWDYYGMHTFDILEMRDTGRPNVNIVGKGTILED
mmetsp:Transcript_24016/g.36932  ORF Transcript_24016/g.36932 Transcript_24016/m.36932 type:complete len:155 (-) Transcript_24016:792-1256(-)